MSFGQLDMVLVKQPDNSIIVSQLLNIDDDVCIGITYNDHIGNNNHVIEFHFSDIIEPLNGLYNTAVRNTDDNEIKYAKCKFKDGKLETFIIDGKEINFDESPFIICAFPKVNKRFNLSSKSVQLEERIFN